MKKIFMVLSACLVAGLMIVSCGKDNSKDQNKEKDEQQDQPGEEEDDYVPVINVDGDFADWADITGVVMDGSNYAELKVIKDERNIFFYSKRMTTGRFNDLWGGVGYYYFGFDLDGEEGNGEANLYDNPGYDLLLLYFPFAGQKFIEGEQEFIPAFAWPESSEEASHNEASPSDYSVEGSTVAGKYTAPTADADGYVETEICTPLENLPELKGPISINSWGNKDANHIILEVTL